MANNGSAVVQSVAARGGSNLRISGGYLKGRRLPVASGVRPTGSRLREALFSIWQTRIEGCEFLDLFAGSGAVGLEAISRGAASATLVEGSPRIFQILKRNARDYAPARTQLIRARLPTGLERMPGKRYGLIFADPPYAFQQVGALLQQAAPCLLAGGEMAVEHSSKLEFTGPPDPWLRRETRCYGDSCLSFFGLDGSETEAGRASS